ncbi:Murein DD-endopeptidase MepM and murein hydrolase activator NlpD, contain LysM domain [Sphingomonas carotinifaciens]|uniref:Murein DD-endopeptidase MepM and murein hydrolase activator NlpD, contain LysM domain n=1 Tax=Sphingomonas carotinifaciens TaxID=1166323 RepID=A0A1G7GWG3_9SPHN|nr:Murein DD-endopeptidase MepM and murein hydrolase activator NlpD, contain LysM domain [Sphingomonas carotinifaciens]
MGPTVFLRTVEGLELAGGTAARPFGRLTGPAAVATPIDRLRDAAAGIDWAPDLGTQIGSRTWWRGLATCTALCATTVWLAPGIRPITGATPAPLAGTAWEEQRAQTITPLAWGADTGRRMGAGDLVAPLAQAPERPVVELAATMGQGDRLASVLQRAGVGRSDARAAADLVAGAVDANAIPSGTRLALTLGRRPNRSVARPLDKLTLRARFDLALTLERTANGLSMTRQPIAVDATPLRIQGLVGASLYRSARAAGAPARAVESYIKALATRLSIGRDVSAADTFDLIVERERAATGEVRLGQLLFAGLDRGGKSIQLVRFEGERGRADWFDAKGQTERRGFMGMPVAGRITSSYGRRMHPLLGFMRMHKGLDIGAPYGAPIYAVLDGVVQFAGRSGGYGNLVKLRHAGGVASAYGHMSRFAVRSGTRVRQGQVIGYVGSTGISTGPHVHWEVWKNGQVVNPKSITFANVAQLSGERLRAFRQQVATLRAVKPGA